MDIRVSGHQVETGDALQNHVEDRLQGIADKYFCARDLGARDLRQGAARRGFRCDIVAHVMQGLVLKGEHEAQDAHVAFDGAAGKIEKQLRRYTRRLKDRHAGETSPRPRTAPIDNAGYTAVRRKPTPRRRSRIIR